MFVRHTLGESYLNVYVTESLRKFRLNLVEDDIDNLDIDALQGLVVQYYPDFMSFSKKIRDMLLDDLFNGLLIQF